MLFFFYFTLRFEARMIEENCWVNKKKANGCGLRGGGLVKVPVAGKRSNSSNPLNIQIGISGNGSTGAKWVNQPLIN